MKRFLATLWLALALAAWPALPQAGLPEAGGEQEPPEEDEALRPQEYTFNPLQAEKEMKIGAFYFKRASFRAAALRFEEATKWNAGYAEAWRRLGEAREKLDDSPGAASAYAKFLELDPGSKQAAAIKKKLGVLGKSKKG